MLILEPRNIKALLRCGVAREMLGDFASAAAVYEVALAVDPGCEQARAGLARVRRR
ncbi:MAG: hypothetical protein ORN28_10445 [Rhodoferax sp.]|nr:hypothetical protein [Rhodoferax sp.]